MDTLLIVIALLAGATFVTGLLLPLATRRGRDRDMDSLEETYAAELAAGN